MWLVDTESLKLVEVQGDPQEEYVILSHTWGSDEVTFQSFQALGLASDAASSPGVADSADQIRSTRGFRKIQDAANLVKSHGHRYLWADTCCIDKTSSAELSESINSMYRWYEKAVICYAFLSDVEPVSVESPFDKDSSFQKSRWFTRGWTLQELIAPRTVEFYAGDWSYVNTKQSRNDFCQLLARITGIDEQVLSGTSFLSDISVANKMRWAGHRETTRPEDKAYCLMGLFKVNMPLLYGEGDRAFTRLQEEILKETDDQSLFLWGMPADVRPDSDDLFGLLANSPSSFSMVDFDYVRPLPPSESQDSTPTSVTNQGLRTSILLIPLRPGGDEYYALLDCIVSKPESASEELSPCIILQRLWSDQFARVPSEEGSVILFPQDHFDDAEGTYENIYVRQNPFYALPELSVKTRLRPSSKDPVSHLAFAIHEAFPPERWDTILSVIRTKEPQSNRTMVVLRFESLERSPRSVVDVAIGLRRVRRRWEVCYEKHPYTGNSLESVYLEFPEITTASDGASYQNSKGLGFITIEAKESQKRGRRFIQLEVSGTSELLSVPDEGGPLSNITNKSPQRLEPVAVFDEVGAVTRSCCYLDRFSLMLSPAVPFQDGVRTKLASNISARFVNELSAIKIEPSKPYADLIRAVRARYDRDVPPLVRQRRGVLELPTEEFDDFRAIHWAAAFGSLSMLKTLMKLGADTTSRTRSGYMAIHLAVLNGHFNLAAYLLEEERESNLKITRPDILQGIISGASQAYHYIEFASGTDPDILHKFTTKRLETVLHLFSAYAPSGLANPRIRKIIDLIKEDFLGSHSFPHTNDLGELPLHRAAATGNMQMVDALTRLMGTNKHIDARDNAGRSVLFHAACGGSNEVIRGLADLGALIDAADDYGRSPLHAAVMADQPAAANALLALGAKADNVTHAFGLTPLHFACLYGSLGCVQELLKSDGSGPADMNRWTTVEYASFQPLHLAVANGHVEIVTWLVRLGCDLEGRCDGFLKIERTDNADGKIGRLVGLESPLTALNLAIVLGKKDMLPQLQQKDPARRYE
ncbi:hypothetical protein CORC01_12570 [Colletotrichum orchidophilum]|uniref:Uncharacterized protein n=1 Tax=Colletotrichum orchidophilum TaxID=1209926 RepID=A0A1G4ASM6_9PEZI|nr:uncharacterized protein CORC01_12570 [Colletotrichum orchidophilum]OHE92115.1 hypothetical protein CORC01_12570 [Colletotrichum orchidophilum]